MTVAVTVSGTGYYEASIRCSCRATSSAVVANFGGTAVLLASTAEIIG